MTPGATHPPFAVPTVYGRDDWYFRVDGKIYGPFEDGAAWPEYRRVLEIGTMRILIAPGITVPDSDNGGN